MLDPLRLLMALWVLAFHYGWRNTGAAPVEETGLGLVAEYGFLGVAIFFAISGYVIAWSADGALGRGVERWAAVNRFARGRVVRLWPAFAVCVTVTAVFTALLADPRYPVSLAAWAANLTFLPQAFGHGFMDGAYWSIVYEIVFYGWVAILMASGLYARALAPVCAVWLVLAGVNEIGLQHGGLRSLFLTDAAGCFVFGLALRRWDVTRRAVWLWLIAAAAIASVGHSLERGAYAWETYGVAMSPTALALVTLGGLTGLRAATLWRPTWLDRPSIVWLGALTYPLYLLHQHIGDMVMVRMGDVPFASKAMLATGMAFALAALVVRVEPVLQRGVRRLLANPFGWRLAQTAGARPR